MSSVLSCSNLLSSLSPHHFDFLFWEVHEASTISGHKIAEIIQDPSFFSLCLWFIYPTPSLSMVEPTVPSTGPPNPKSSSATGKLRPDDITRVGPPPSPITLFESINPGL
ncbi:cysteine sulfinic acid decarboxylase [Striga asiatica]|uniref:Cysteine sulfinic acid decarboxylase n=1 Tax=Striga asiatica TaxID=4170 RepID=A0A5A7PBH5_STRAF|nr:cysteine sulfinic acid decarboxylase [Striga asiatica]